MHDHITTAELNSALPHIMDAPKDASTARILCFRPAYGQREFPATLQMTSAHGIPGERWLKAPWMKLADGSPDPRIQVSILPLRVMDLVWRDRTGTPHPGDSIVSDIDTSYANMPVGTLLQAGRAVLRVSDVFNDGCVKWKVRYGTDAKDWIVAPDHVPLRLRGVLCSIEQDGEVNLNDAITVLYRPV